MRVVSCSDFLCLSRRLLLIVGLVATATGCASPPPPPINPYDQLAWQDHQADLEEYREINDPLEPLNRYVFAVNQIVDLTTVRPASEVYRTVVPRVVRDRVSSVFDNAGAPVRFVNTLLQGRFRDSATVLGRLILNTTIGLGGMFDVAQGLGLPPVQADFGQTLHSWGIGEGPFLMLPTGPSNVRDALGSAVDIGIGQATDPLTWVSAVPSGTHYGLAGGGLINRRAELSDTIDTPELMRGSVDLYVQIRSASRQQRRAALTGQTTSPAAEEVEDIYSEFDDLEDE